MGAGGWEGRRVGRGREAPKEAGSMLGIAHL